MANHGDSTLRRAMAINGFGQSAFCTKYEQLLVDVYQFTDHILCWDFRQFAYEIIAKEVQQMLQLRGTKYATGDLFLNPSGETPLLAS